MPLNLLSKNLKFVLIATLVGLSGCTLNDPNHNDKMRYSMAQIHADRILSEYDSNLEWYELEIFWRKHYEADSKVSHLYQLYDYLKISPGPGPERFVIAYDDVTRQTYLRKDLRSNENLDAVIPPVRRENSIIVGQ